MGTSGAGVFENDHALDLLSGEVHRLVEKVEAVLALPQAAFDDIEGPLVYAHMLARLAEEREIEWSGPGFDRGVVETWKATYLHIFNSTVGTEYPDYVARRREVIAREFDALAARPPEASTVPRPRRAHRKKATTRAPK